MRLHRQRKKEKRECEEFNEFLRNTPFSSSTTDNEKFQIFLKKKEEKKLENRKRKHAEKCKKYRNKKLKTEISLPLTEEQKKKVQKKKKTDVEKVKKCRLKKKLEIEKIQMQTEQISTSEPIITATDIEFRKRFYDNKFGVTCFICDRLWFEQDMKHVPQKALDLVREKYPNENLSSKRVCDTCYRSLLDKKIPRLATINGFRYPPFPSNLPPLDSICERLVSPHFHLCKFVVFDFYMVQKELLVK
jgi:hypothetical protein